MLGISKRSRLARIAGALAALGASLLGASVAQGAMGTSTTLITTARPDLVSVTTPGSQGGPTADFCFSKGLGVASTATPDLFELGGYDDDNELEADSIAQINNFCIEATFTDDDQNDLVSYSLGRVQEEAVEADEGGGENFDDSTALNGSDTNNGTRGFTIGPDLQQVVIRQSQNQIDYVFDQEVIDPVANGSGFKYIDQAGDDHFSNSATVESASDGRERVVRAQFTDVVDDVTDAVIAVAEPAAVVSRTNEGVDESVEARNERFAVTVSGTSGDTNDPDLVSTELVSGGDSDLMLFTYNGQIDPGGFESCYAIASSGETAVAESILVTGANTLQVEFDESFSNVTELVVGGADSGGCVTDANTDESSTQGAKPAGGNVGAQAAGYVTGPDAQALTINRSNDTAVVRLDQRTDPSNWDLGDIHLVGPNGANITEPTQGTVPTQGPGPQPLTLDFGASEIPEGTVGIRFDENALQSLTTTAPARSRGGERRPGVRRGRACPVAVSTERFSSRAGGHQAARSFSPSLREQAEIALLRVWRSLV